MVRFRAIKLTSAPSSPYDLAVQKYPDDIRFEKEF